MMLVWPAVDHLPGYVAALKRGWSADNVRGHVAADEELAAITLDGTAFLAGLVDREAEGDPVTLPDGSQVPRLPGYRRWLWDGEFCGVIGFRWQRGTEALPPHCLGHIGYAVVPWKRGRGHATEALRQLLPEVRAEGLAWVEITTDPDNVASRRVIEANGGGCSSGSRSQPSSTARPACATASRCDRDPRKDSLKKPDDQHRQQAQHHAAGEGQEPLAAEQPEAKVPRQAAESELLQPRPQPAEQQQRQENDQEPADHAGASACARRITTCEPGHRLRSRSPRC